MSSGSATDHPPRHTAAVQHLTRAECLERLASGSLGRLAVAGPGPAPIIRPVNYVFDSRSQSVVFRSAEGSKFNRLVRETHAAFEVDGAHEAPRAAWSVIIVGVTEEVRRPQELRWLETLPLHSWVVGPEAGHWLRIRAWTVSGRLIQPAQPVPAVSSPGS